LVHVRCSNKEKGKDAKAVCEVACIKCKLCEKNCPEGAIAVVGDAGNSIAVIDYDKCTSCGICVTKCPTNALEIILPINAAQKMEQPVNTNAPHACQKCGLCQ
ncbi:MAG TPA: 4Fe-4S binding protein, partial [Peptococcaceae bacterium]|nr:4Fe-4S binding protein [Peptococcaceae bacterium]